MRIPCLITMRSIDAVASSVVDRYIIYLLGRKI